MVRVALWHPRWTLLRASVCQLWWMLGLHGVASALGGTQKEVYAEPGAMKASVAWRAKTREKLTHRLPQKQASLAQTTIPPNKPPKRPTR